MKKNTNHFQTALIGCGYWGTNIARNFNDLGALAAVVDSLSEHRDAAKKLYPDVAIHETIENVLTDESIQGIVIATPATTHAKLTQQALEAGKDVFVEKPLALTLEDGEELVAEARDRGAILLVGHLLELILPSVF